MQDVMKKRIVGAIVLVIIGVLIPLLLARCLNGGDGGTQSMRVYEITPEGEARRAEDGDSQSAAAEQAGGAGGNTTGDAAGADESAPAPVSPQSDADSTAAGPSESDETTPDSTQPPDLPPEPAAEPQAESAPEPESDPESPDAGSGEADSTASDDGAQRRDDAPAGGGWVVQVASFRQESNAQAVAEALEGDFDAYYRSGDVDGTTYYRVRVGPFESEDAARAAASTLRSQGRSTLVQRNR